MDAPISFTQLAYAVAVGTHGSFSAAARACLVSQPALSEMILKLEQALGLTLFDRQTNPVTVTDVGREILAQASTALRETERLREIADAWSGQVRGILRVGMIPTVAPGLIPVFLPGMRTHHPEVHIELIEAPTDSLLSALQKNEIDVAILSTPRHTPGHFLEKSLFYEPFQIYAATGSPLLAFGRRKRSSITLKDLEGQKLILMDETHCARDQVLAICEPQKLDNVTTVRGGLHTLISVVDFESGYTLIPQLLGRFVNPAQLREFEAGTHTRKISMLFNKAQVKRKLVDVLATEIIAKLPAKIEAKRQHGRRVVMPSSDRFHRHA